MTSINNPPPTITTYEEHLFDSLVGDLIAKAKNKKEKADAYTSALVMCSTLKQVEHAYKNGADLLEMARKAPRSVIHLLKSKHTFSTHPPKRKN